LERQFLPLIHPVLELKHDFLLTPNHCFKLCGICCRFYCQLLFCIRTW